MNKEESILEESDTRYRILVIEDDYKIKEIVQSILEEKNYDVFGCTDGKTGIKLAETLKPKVIVCDIMLPDIDGYEICHRIRNNPETENIIFIFLTAKTQMDNLRKGMDCGADDYLTKPFKASKLLEVINLRIDRFNKAMKDSKPIKSDDESTERFKLESNIFIGKGEDTKIIKIKDINAISAELVYTKIHTNDSKVYLVRKSLNEWEKLLPKNQFFRTHRSYIVNQSKIKKISPWFKNSFLVKVENSEEEFFISERYAVKLKKRFSF